MQVSIHTAKANLSKLIEAALAGEEVVIAKGDKPLVKLVAIAAQSFTFGVLAGQLTGPVPDFFAPISGEELAAWEGA